MEEELVPSVEDIENLRPLLEDLVKAKSIIRVFKDGTIPPREDRKIKVYAQIHHDSLSSIRPPMIPKSIKESRPSITFVYIAPANDLHDLSYFWHVHNLLGAKNPIVSFCFDEAGGHLTLAEGDHYSLFGGVHYNFHIRQSTIHESVKNDFDEKGKVFDLSEFGWGDY